MKKGTILSLFVLVTALGVGPAMAGEIAGVVMEDTIAAQGHVLSLVGMGVRNKVVVKVYAAGLYMAEPSLDPEEIVASDQPKALRMLFLYKKVEGDKLREAWVEGFEKNTPDAPPDLKERMERFVSLFSADAMKGEEYLFSYVPGTGTTVRIGDREAALIEGSDFASALMRIWFGDYPADKGLKKSVLEGMD